jgi:[ribosomal protein S5]-alanine N-acetyltransferase
MGKSRILELKSGKIVLRQLEGSDMTRLAELCNNKKVWDNLRDIIPFPYTEKDAMDFIRQCQAEDPQYNFAIDYDGELAGCIGLVRQADVYRLSAEIGYWLGEPYWGKGIATKSVLLLTRYGFRELGLMRIFAGVFESNKASQRVLEKAGYRLDCIAEKAVFKNTELMDEYRYSIIMTNQDPDK